MSPEDCIAYAEHIAAILRDFLTDSNHPLSDEDAAPLALSVSAFCDLADTKMRAKRYHAFREGREGLS